MDGVINTFPAALFKDASPRSTKQSFHPKTREACKGDKLLDGVTSKIIVVGDLGVGKTSMINRYVRNEFERDYKPTIGVEYELKKYSILKTVFSLQIWDTSGEERFKAITSAYYRGSNALLVTFDLCDPVSLVHARTWTEEALNNTRTTTPDVYLVGNKKDMCKANVLGDIREDAKALCGELNAEYWEVSAKSGENVRELFLRVSAVCFDEAVLRHVDKQFKRGTVNIQGGGSEMQTIQLGKRKQNGNSELKAKSGCCK